jgi:hypothetical protein
LIAQLGAKSRRQVEKLGIAQQRLVVPHTAQPFIAMAADNFASHGFDTLAEFLGFGKHHFKNHLALGISKSRMIPMIRSIKKRVVAQ